MKNVASYRTDYGYDNAYQYYFDGAKTFLAGLDFAHNFTVRQNDNDMQTPKA